MRIAFIDATGWDFNVDTPFVRPLGGSHSAACYLAIALAGAGHDVYFVSATSQPGNVRGVNCLSTRTFTPQQLPELNLDAAILLLGANPGRKMRDALGPAPKLILWTGHDVDQSAVTALADPLRRDVFDGFAFMSEWQARRFVQKFSLPTDRTAALRNGVAPAFLEHRFTDAASILAAKRRPPVLAYTSTPYRGLDVLLALFPQIRARVPGARLQVYSDMSMYMESAQEDEREYGELYRLCRETDGVEYVGALPQPVLAGQLREVSVLAYTNTFVETACIAVLEAMASGCRIVTSDLGALPETTAGFATLIPVDRGPEEYARRFVEATVTALNEMNAPATGELLARQVRHVAEHADWNERAAAWARWLTELPAGRHALAPASAEQTFPLADLPRNNEPMDPYFGQFIGLLRRSLANGGSEMGLGLSLFSLAASIRAATVIEIGRFKGFSTLALASALRLLDIGWDEAPISKERPEIDYATFEGPRKRRLFSIDPFPTPEAKALLAEADLLSYVTSIDQRSDQVELDVAADLIFIDGDHTYEGCMNDVRRFVGKNLRPGGYFVLHDYYGWYNAQRKSASPVRAVIEQLVSAGELEHLLIDTGYMSFVTFRKPDPAAAATLAKV
jgi:glycosyltransferase involved in cell wall biosynthesis/predicted O-methyltransferase YrrM